MNNIILDKKQVKHIIRCMLDAENCFNNYLFKLWQIYGEELKEPIDIEEGREWYHEVAWNLILFMRDFPEFDDDEFLDFFSQIADCDSDEEGVNYIYHRFIEGGYIEEKEEEIKYELEMMEADPADYFGHPDL